MDGDEYGRTRAFPRPPSRRHASRTPLFAARRLVRVTALGVAVVLAGCDMPRARRRAARRFFRLGTVVEVTLVASRDRDLGDTWRSVDSLLSHWDSRFSAGGDSSEVRRVNEAGRGEVALSARLTTVLHDALRFADTLGGAFDPTVLPLKKVWGLAEDEPVGKPIPPPSDSAVRAASRLVDYRRLRLDPRGSTLTRLDATTAIDIGGIAKGAALAEIGRLLVRLGFRDYLVSAGGDVSVSGRRPDGRSWLIGIRHPCRRDRLIATLPLDSGTVVTSGDYERYRVIDGKRVHHIFDPHTGRCCRRNRSVTIWSTDPVEADAFSTGLFCFPADSILAFVHRRPRLACVVVDSSGGRHASRGWEQRIEWR